MAGPITGSRAIYIYQSDNTLSYFVSHSTPKAVAGNFGSSGPASGGNKPRTMKMRYVRGVITGSGGADSAPATITLPVASPSDPLIVGTTTTFTVTYPWGAVTYKVTGIFGEKRERLAAG